MRISLYVDFLFPQETAVSEDSMYSKIYQRKYFKTNRREEDTEEEEKSDF